MTTPEPITATFFWPMWNRSSALGSSPGADSPQSFRSQSGRVQNWSRRARLACCICRPTHLNPIEQARSKVQQILRSLKEGTAEALTTQ